MHSRSAPAECAGVASGLLLGIAFLGLLVRVCFVTADVKQCRLLGRVLLQIV